MRHAVYRMVLAAVVCLLALTTCDKTPQEQYVLNEKVRQPETDSQLQDVIARNDSVGGKDTLFMIYQPGATKPSYQNGDILFGAKRGGYMKRVLSTSVNGDTLIVICEQVGLLQVFDKCKLDTTFSVVPTELILPETLMVRGSARGTRDGANYNWKLSWGTPVLTPSSDGFSITVPNVKLEVMTAAKGETAAVVQAGAIVFTKRVDVDAAVNIDWPADYKGFHFNFDCYDTIEFRDVEFIGGSVGYSFEFDTSQCCFNYKVPVMAGPIPLTFDASLYCGVLLKFDAQAGITSQMTAYSHLHAAASHVAGQEMTGELTCTRGANMEIAAEGSVNARIEAPYFELDLGAKIAGVVGPYVAGKTALYAEAAVGVPQPPLTITAGFMLSAEYGVKAEFIGIIIVEKHWPIAQIDIPIARVCWPLIDNFETWPHPIYGNDWNDSAEAPSTIGTVTGGRTGSCLEITDPTAPDSLTDSSAAWAETHSFEDPMSRADFWVYTTSPSFHVGVRALDDISDWTTCSWYLIFLDGKLYYFDGQYQEVCTINPGSWQKVTISKINWSTNTYNISVDGNLLKEGASFLGANPGSDRLMFVDFATSRVPTDGFRFDDIVVMTGFSHLGAPRSLSLPEPMLDGNPAWE